MACRIVFRNSEGRSNSVELGWGAVEIGAAPECRLRISDPSAAPVIARIELRNNYYWIVNVSGDCEIDGTRFDARQLVHNDAVRCGPLWIRFIADHSPAPLRFEPPGTDQPLADRMIRPPVELSGSIVSMPSGPDASPPGRRR
jgi:hypothetical protein